MKKYGMKILIAILLVAVAISTYNMFFVEKEDVNNNQEIDSALGKKVEPTITTDFLMYIDEVGEVDTGILVKGTVFKGEVSVNSEISIVGLEKKEAVCNVLKITKENNSVEKAVSGEKVGILLETKFDIENFEKGQTAIATGTIKPVYTAEIKITSMNVNINDLVEQINIVNINTDLKCEASVVSERDNTIKIKLDKSCVLAKDKEVFLKSGSSIIAKGIIVK